MPSAVKRVFADPQLLERILSQLIDKDVPYTSLSDVRDLANLLRTDRRFAKTISSSKELRWRMGLESRQRKHERGIPLPHIAVTALCQGEVSFPPFKFCVRSSYLYTRLSKRPKTLILFFHVPADAFAEEYVGTLGYRAGLRTNGERIHRGKQQSWRRMRLAAREMSVAVVVAVFRPRVEMEIAAPEPYCLEWVQFRAGEGTLGDLAEFFNQIGWKERSEHEMRISRFNGEFWADLKYEEPTPLRWPTRRAVLALLFECFRVCLIFLGAKWSALCIWNCMIRHPFVVFIGLLVLAKVVEFGSAIQFRIVESRCKRKEDEEDIKRSKIFN